MGNWITSTFLRFDSLFFSRNNNWYIEYQTKENHINSNPQFLPRVAEILDRDNMHKNQLSDGNETDFSSDDECPQMSANEQMRMFEREREIAFQGRVSIGDPESVGHLREGINMRCWKGPSTSIAHLCAARELGSARGGDRVMSNRVRTELVNTFMPNRRKIVEKVNTKTFCCQYTKNGNILIVASQDEKIRFYHKNSSKCFNPAKYVQFNEMRVDVCSWSILDVSVCESANALCYSTWKNAIFLTSFENPDNITDRPVTWHNIELDEHEHNIAIFCLRFSKDGNQIVCGASDHSIHVFDAERRVRVRTLRNAHEDDVNTVCFADESSNLIYSGGDDGLVKVWDRRAWRDGDATPVGVFAGHRDGVTYVDSRCDDRYLLSNCKDQTIKIWDLRKCSSKIGIDSTRECVRKQQWDYRWHPAPPGLCQPIEGDTSVMTLRGHNVLHTLVRAKFSPERTGKRYIYTGCARGEIVVYDLMTGQVSNRLKGHSAVVRDMDWNPEENEIASCSWDGVTSVWYYDERARRKTHPSENADFGDEDSCDEWFQPISRQSRKNKKCATSTTRFNNS